MVAQLTASTGCGRIAPNGADQMSQVRSCCHMLGTWFQVDRFGTDLAIPICMKTTTKQLTALQTIRTNGGNAYFSAKLININTVRGLLNHNLLKSYDDADNGRFYGLTQEGIDALEAAK